ncbi:MAG TPA: SDR family oxidoreductase [Polyangia bacterium]|jgi:citronellol/citronellal dehydrogenase
MSSRSPFRPDLNQGAVAIVTGGGTGIGRAIALGLAQTGARVAICGRRPEPLAAVKGELAALGGECLAEPCDIREPEQVARFVAAVRGRFGAIDVLVNNAGGQRPYLAADLPLEHFEKVVRNNLTGTFLVTQTVAREAMIPQRRGAVVSIIAQIARGFPGMAHTGAARAGVDNLTKSLAVEWARHGLRVNAIAPGTIRSSGTDRYPPELIEGARRAIPLKRLGTPEEVADLAVFLVSPAAAFITGATYTIDGGASLWGDLFPIPD